MTLKEFEKEVIGHVMRQEDSDLLELCRQYVNEHDDPAHYCGACKSMTRSGCDCPPAAANE